MDQRTRASLASGFIGLVFLAVQVGALALVTPFDAAGYQAVEDPQNPVNSIVYLVAILAVTALMLVVIRLDRERFIRLFVVFASGYLAWYVFSVAVPPVATYAGVNLGALAAAGGLAVALYLYPEWYVIDAAGVVMGAGAAALFGISFGILPALVLLGALAVYDAVSVYGTEHMLTLASGVMDLKVPIVLVVPLSLSYSFLDADLPDPTGEVEDGAAEAGNDGQESVDGTDVEADPFDREAMFIGLGDAVIPTVLVASAAVFLEGVPTYEVAGLALTLPSLGAMAGTMLGLALLLRMVLKGAPHAGLPLLNGGAILGYLAGALASGVPLLAALGVARYL
ncbi:MAG: presenilin family intramembrane aspartyl protease PSH [Halorientalis sp.]